MQFAPVPNGIGVVAHDFAADLTTLTDEDIAALRSAYFEHGLVLFRGREICLDEQFAVCNALGARIDQAGSGITWKNVSSTGRSEMGELSFHADFCNAPAEAMLTGASLCATELPRHPTATIFASSIQALNTMPSDLLGRVAGRTAIHSATLNDEAGKSLRHNLANSGEPRAEHPIVFPHPETGAQSLYVSDMNTERVTGLPDDESTALLDEIVSWQQQPQFVYRHVWQLHDLVLWDQILITHKREYEKNDNDTGARVLRRVSFTHPAWRTKCQAFFDLPRIRQGHRVNAGSIP